MIIIKILIFLLALYFVKQAIELRNIEDFIFFIFLFIIAFGIEKV